MERPAARPELSPLPDEAAELLSGIRTFMDETLAFYTKQREWVGLAQGLVPAERLQVYTPQVTDAIDAAIEELGRADGMLYREYGVTTVVNHPDTGHLLPIVGYGFSDEHSRFTVQAVDPEGTQADIPVGSYDIMAIPKDVYKSNNFGR
jgi:hypothetical protein